MKVNIVISSLRAGGAERVASNLAIAWVNRGYSVSLTTIGSSLDDFYILPSDVKRISLDTRVPSKNILQKVSMNLKRFLSLRNSIKTERPDVILAMMPTTAVLTILASISLGARVVVAEHSFPARSAEKIVWRLARKYTYKFSACVVVLTDESGDWLRENTNTSQLKTIPNAIEWPLKNYDPYLDTGFLSSSRKRFIAVGRLHPVKAFDRLLTSFSMMANDEPEWDLVIVGTGLQEASLLTLAKKLDIQERVIFTGAVGNVADFYRACDVFVLSSNNEGFPVALLEAMASGLCVVSVRCQTGPADIITHEHDGLLCSINTKELSKSMYRAASDSILREQLAGEAVNVINTYSTESIMALWDDLFASLGVQH